MTCYDNLKGNAKSETYKVMTLNNGFPLLTPSKSSSNHLIIDSMFIIQVNNC